MKKIAFSVIGFCFSFSVLSSYSANTYEAGGPDRTEEFLFTKALDNPLGLDKKARLISMTVITKEDVEKCIGCDLIEILEKAGVQVRRYNARFSESSDTDIAYVSLRGVSDTQTLLLVDNVRQEDATRSISPWISIPVHHIERIEIVRGPQSAYYGDSAVGGVVHIFTQKADCFTGTFCAGGGVDFSNKAGTGKTIHMDANVRTDQSGFRIGVQGDKSVDAEKVDGDYKEKMLTLNLDHRTEDGKWLIEGSSVLYGDHDTGKPLHIDKRKSDVLSLGTTYYVSPDLLFSSVVGYNREEQSFANQVAVYGNPTVYGSRRVSIKLLGEYHFDFSDSAYVLAAGMDTQRETVDSSRNEYDHIQRNTRAVFTHLTGEKGPFVYQLSVRMDDISGDTHEQIFTWKGSASYHLGNLMNHDVFLRSGIGTGFRIPGFDERYLYRGDPNLPIERSRTHELGVRVEREQLYFLDIGLFETVLDDPVIVPVTERLAGDASIQGLEVQTGFTMGPWEGRVQYAYTDINNASALRAHYPLRETASVGVDYHVTPEFILGVGMVHKGKRKGTNVSDEVDVFDIYSLYHLNENVRFGVAVKNVEDKEYNMGHFTNGPARTLWITFDIIGF